MGLVSINWTENVKEWARQKWAYGNTTPYVCTDDLGRLIYSLMRFASRAGPDVLSALCTDEVWIIRRALCVVFIMHI